MLSKLTGSFLLLFCAIAVAADVRHALVIGNASYRHAAVLQNTLNDARDLADELQQAGFKVRRVENTGLHELIDAVDGFVNQLHASGGVGLLYYSGHGVQVDGQNYLVPVDARLQSRSKIKYEAYALNDALRRMGGRGAGSVNLVILDACRDNPFASTRSLGSKGLAKIDAPESTLILYAAKPGQTASDNPQGRNGLFTKHLRQAIRRPGVNVEVAFGDVVKEVYQESGRQQYPWKEGVLLEPFQFASGGEQQVQKAPAMPFPDNRAIESQADIEYWNWAKTTNSRESYQLYLDEFPSGRFAQLAKLSLQGMQASSAPDQATPVDDAKEEIQRLVERYIQLQNKADIKAIGQVYARRVNYFNKAGADRAFIKKDKASYFKRWPEVKMLLLEPVEIAPLIDPDKWQVVARIGFDVYSGKRRQGVRGVSRNTFVVKHNNGFYRVVAQREKVTKRKKYQ